MSTMSTKNQPRGWEDQQGTDGVDFYNPNPGQHDYLSKFENNPIGRQQEIDNLEAQLAHSNVAEPNYTNLVRQKEMEPNVHPQVPNARNMTDADKNENRNFNKNVLVKLFGGKKLKGKSAAISLLLVLFGGGGLMSAFFTPNLALIQMKELMTKNLNDQFHAMDERSAVLLRAKLKDTTKGSCGVIKINCRFATITDKQVEKFKAAGIEVKTVPKEERKWFNGNRGEILEISHKGTNGEVKTAKTASELTSILTSADGKDFRSGMLKGYNPKIMSVSDRVALSYISKLKASKGLVVSGETDEEKQKQVNAVVAGIEGTDAKSIVIKKDENGKELYYDSEGNELTKEEVDAAREQSERIDERTKNGGTRNLLTSAVKGASIVGYMDSACTLYNSLRMVSALSKAKKEAQAARFAMAMVLTPADAAKAGAIKEDENNYVNNNLSATRPAGQVVDETKLYQPGSSATPATIADPEAGQNAYDGPGYRMMAYGEAPDLSLRASQYMIGGGSVVLLDGLLKSAAFIINNGDANPKEVSEKCGYVQNPVVRFTGLAIGVAAGIGTFGLTTAVGVGGSLALAMALPYIESQAADIITGNVFKDATGVDSGDIAVVGSTALFGGIAKNRGLKPLSADEGMKYAAASQKSHQAYDETQQYMARATPFDITNPYSFMGSLAGTINPVFQRSKSAASMAMINIGSLIPTSFAGIVKPAGAARVLDENYYKKCNDQGYAQLGIGADVFCGVHYGLSQEELAMDPIENGTWMAINGEIDPESETGDAKDNGQEWNYAKFLKECAFRTVGWGENEEENQGDGSNCVDAKNEGKNKHYRVFTLDKTVDQSMDGEPIASSGNSYSKNDGKVSTSGWAFPMSADATISSGFETNERPDHHGVDLARGNAADTLNQPIFAARDGEVMAAGKADGYGNWIVIKHEISGKTYSTVYGHMYDDGVLVKTGDKVKAGQQIGKVGSNGQSSGPHLHFEIWEGSPLGDGKHIDPTPIIEASRGRNGNGSADSNDGAINV